MQNNSYFKYNLYNIKNIEEKLWNIMESKNFSSIIKQYVKAVEDKHLKNRYTAPKIQTLFIQLLRIFGF